MSVNSEAIATGICPVCGRKAITPGYGLAGGGFGPYWFCDSEVGCPWFYKEQESSDDE